MESLLSPEMGNTSVGILSTLLPVATTGELSSRLTRAREESSTRVSGPVTGCQQISVEVVLAILVVHTSVCRTFAFRVPWCKAQNPRSVQDRSLLLHPRPRQAPPQVAHARPQLAKTMMEPICSPVPSTPAVQTNAAATALPPPVVLATHGSMLTMNAG